MAISIISRESAKAQGLKFCFSGRPCGRGHIARRYVSSYYCVECERRSERKAKIKAYDHAHKDERREYFKTWVDQNRDRVNELGCLWAKRNPEKHAMRSRLRRARKRNAEGEHSIEEIKELLSKQKYKCASCFASLRKSYEVDHVIPLSKGGCNMITNIQLLCVSCNRRKNAKDPFRWALENGRLL